MGLAEALALLAGATKLAGIIAPIIQRLFSEGRTELTPAEMALIDANKQDADEGWQKTLQALRDKAKKTTDG